MKRNNRDVWGAATGYLVVLFGIAAVMFERGAPPINAAAETVKAYMTQYRNELLLQSLVFIISSGAYIWFINGVRAFLTRSEKGKGGMSAVFLVAGKLYIALQLTLQTVQIATVSAIGVDSSATVPFSILGYSISVVAYVPFAVMCLAVAAASFGSKAFPAWVGWLSAVTAAANVLMTLGIVMRESVFTPGGPVSYAVYALIPVWLISVTTTMILRLRKMPDEALKV
jgi:hypothetical protein